MSEAATAFTGSIPDAYDRYMGPMMFEPFALDMARRFSGFRGRLLETAAGTGRVTRALAKAAPEARIVATDLNEPMLALAGREVTAPNVEWRQADALALPFADQSFEAMVCQFGVMFFPNKAKGYAEAARMLKPGGRYVFSVWDGLEHNDLSLVVEETVADVFPDQPPDFFARVPFGYADDEVIREGVRGAGFASVEVERIALPTPAPSAADAARGLVLGTPLRMEIESRFPGRLDQALGAVTEAIRARFGDGPITGRGQALVVTAGR